MKINKIDAYALSSPISPPQDRPFHAGTRRLLKRDIVLVVIETKTGEYGVAPAGASSSAMREYFEGESQGTLAEVVNGPVSDALEQKWIEHPSEAHTLLEEADLPTHLRIKAASAIDVALYDLLGKLHGTPVYELLNQDPSELQTQLPLYASAGMYMQPEEYVDQAKILETCGFFGYKYRPGIGPSNDRETITSLCEAVDIEVMVDAHTWWKMDGDSYDSETVASLVKNAGEEGVYWVEEPVEPDDHSGYTDLNTFAPIAGGESEQSSEGLRSLAQTGGVDFLQGDVRHHSGFTGCLSAAEHCEGTRIEFVPHNFGTWLGLVANAHLVAAAPETELLEYPVFEKDPTLDTAADPGMYPFDLAFDIIHGVPSITDGELILPDEPGLGVDLDFDVIDKYPFVDGPWTEFHYTN